LSTEYNIWLKWNNSNDSLNGLVFVDNRLIGFVVVVALLDPTNTLWHEE
jgi:hypothetical protein